MAKDERDKLLEIAIRKLEKEKKTTGLVIRGCARRTLAWPHVPTGSLALDIALGIGGYPRGRITEISGDESVGKCLPISTYMLSGQGLLTIGEIFHSQNITPACTSSTTICQFDLVNRWGELEKTTHFTCNNRRSLRRIKTRSGAVIESTYNHPHLVLNQRGNWVWTKTKDLQSGDYLVSLRGAQIFGPRHCPSAEAYLLGLMMADGTLQEKRIGITNDDPAIIDFLTGQASEILGIKPCVYDNNKGSLNFHFNSKEKVAAFYKRHGLKPCTSPEKQLPAEIRSLDRESMVAFIQGFFDCESYVNGTIETCSASHELLWQFKLILQNFGIISSLHEKSVPAYPDKEYWRLIIGGSDAGLFRDLIGSKSQKQQTRMAGLSADLNRFGRTLDLIPHLQGILMDLRDGSETNRQHNEIIGGYLKNHLPSYASLGKILTLDWSSNLAYQRLEEINQTNYFYDLIVDTADLKPKPTFDFAMRRTHSFIANGFVSHNTTLALNAVAYIQKEGGNALYVDAEHALDLEYAASLGVDVERLFLCQPDNGSDGMDVIHSLGLSGGIDIVVVDSVPGMIPEAMADGMPSDQHMGQLARLMSQSMPMIVPWIRKHNVCFLFLNQIRMKIGVMFGNPETTCGGKALPLFSSVRVKLNRVLSKEIKNTEDERIGNQVNFNVIKNKMASPFKKGGFDIWYGHGIDKYGELITLGTEYEIIQQSGAWFSYNDEQIGQGRNNARDFLAERPDLAAEIEAKIRAAAFGSLDSFEPIEDPNPDPFTNEPKIGIDESQLSVA